MYGFFFVRNVRSNGNSVLNTKRLTKIKWWPHGGLICTHWIYRKIESLYVDRSRECGSTIQNARKCDRIRPRKNVKFVEPVEMTNGWYDINKTRPVLWSVAACGCCAFFLIFFFFSWWTKFIKWTITKKEKPKHFLSELIPFHMLTTRMRRERFVYGIHLTAIIWLWDLYPCPGSISTRWLNIFAPPIIG